MAWRPGQARIARALEDPYTGVPSHLKVPLWAWVQDGFFDHHSYTGDPSRLMELGVHLRIALPQSTDRAIETLATKCNNESDFMLTLAEALLERYKYDGGRAQGLQNLLRAANSAYVVKDSADGLEERVAPGVKETVTAAVASAQGSAGDHLTKAWNAAYGRRSDPGVAYGEAVKAVEAALAAHVSPQNAKQTLGTMIRDVAAKPSKWKFVIADGNASGVEMLVSMMRVLWDGQTSRHGGTGTTRAETPEEARAAVHLAATIVQLGVSGAFAAV